MNLIKKAGLTAVLMSAASVFAAQPFYYGAGLGLGQNNSVYNTSVAPSSSSSTASSATTSVSTGGTSGQIFGFVGYQHELSDSFKASVQADIGYDSLSKTIINIAGNTDKLKSGFNYGASVRLGTIRGDFAPYLVAGVRAGQWKNTQATTAYSSTLPSTDGTSLTYKKTVVGPELGVGINFTLSNEIDGRMEYKYFFGGNMNASGTNTTAGVDYTSQVKVRQQSVQWSLVF